MIRYGHQVPGLPPLLLQSPAPHGIIAPAPALPEAESGSTGSSSSTGFFVGAAVAAVAVRSRHMRAAQHKAQIPARPRRTPQVALGLFGSVAAAGLWLLSRTSSISSGVWTQFWGAPVAYLTIPVCAALVGYGTNWVGVKMIFYPINFWGIPIRRVPEQPLGFIGWQGIVPAKVRKMSRRLVEIVVTKLLSLEEAFGRLDPNRLAELLVPSVSRAIERDARWGEAWIALVRPYLFGVLVEVVTQLQKDISTVLDLREVVSSAFLRDKALLGECFQKAARKELTFLVDSGLTFGFVLGILQMVLWIVLPNGYTLPVGGALVGYITNWVAIKLIFEPVEPTQIGPFVMQGMFEKRQAEVSEEFSEFLSARVLTSPRLIDEMVNGRHKNKLEALVRKAVPSVVPDDVAKAAIGALRRLATEPRTHPVHVYIDQGLGLQDTLTVRLKGLSAADFENLLHPVFQEDEIILIIAGGVLGAAAGALQMFLGWGGPPAPAAVVGAGVAGAAISKALLVPFPVLSRWLRPCWALLRERLNAFQVSRRQRRIQRV